MNNENHVMLSNKVLQNSNDLPIVVVMVPLPAQGHLNQLLHLSHLISTFHIPVHFVGTPTHNRQVQLRCVRDNSSQISSHPLIQFHDFDIPPFSSPPPNPAASHRFPSHLIPSFIAAALHLHRPLAAFLRTLSSKVKRIVVIHDSLMSSSLQDVNTIPNTESYCFHSVSAFTVALHSLERKVLFVNDGHKDGEITTAIYEQYFPKELNVVSMEECFPPEFLEFIGSQFRHLPKMGAGKIYNTCRVIEGEFLEVIQRIEPEFRHWALGPFNPLKISKNGGDNEQSSCTHSCMGWLDQQEPRSVIYISFGTTTALKDEQIKEIAIGLARSDQKFIWVLRDADKSDVFDVNEIRKSNLPKGYSNLNGNQGLVIRDWAPQLEILSHWATGGFMTHCGWNSCMESITNGVPVIAWPMHSDQPRNTVLMIIVLCVGIALKEWQQELVIADAVEEVVRKLMVSEEGAELRRNAERLGNVVRQSLEEDGESRQEFEAFVAHITR